MLHDYGKYDSITASSSSVADAKKMLLSRQARYSGLIDLLKFSEQEFSEALSGATVWLAINVNEAELPAQLDVAKAAGVSRVFVLTTADGPSPTLSDAAALTAKLDASGLAYTVMRTGCLDPKSSGGGGLKLGEIDLPTCETVGRDDVFRFVTEALTLPGASGRLFSFCPSVDASQLKEMRLAGCDRREEAEALLAGVIVETLPEEQQKEVVVDEEEARISAAEAEAEREEELKELLVKARERGIESAKKQKEKEEFLAAKRAERAQYYIATEEEQAEAKGEKGESDEDPSPPSSPPSSPPPPKPPSGGGDSDKPDEPPLAMA